MDKEEIIEKLEDARDRIDETIETLQKDEDPIQNLKAFYNLSRTIQALNPTKRALKEKAENKV